MPRTNQHDDATSQADDVRPERLEDLDADDAGPLLDDLDAELPPARDADDDDDEEMDILVDLYDDDLDYMEGPDA